MSSQIENGFHCQLGKLGELGTGTLVETVLLPNLETTTNRETRPYRGAEHGRESEILFGIVDDQDHWRCQDVAHRSQGDQHAHADHQGNGGAGLARSRVIVQSGPNAAPVIDAACSIS